MQSTDGPSAGARVAYVVKRYPRFSETFIVNEVLAHEAAGMKLDVYSLLQPDDEHFQDVISRVRAPIRYLKAEGIRANDFWGAAVDAGALIGELWARLDVASTEQARYVYQALKLATEVRRRSYTHIHAHFASAPTTVARLAARLAGITYSFTAHAKDIFHEAVDREDLRRKIEDAKTIITVSDFNAGVLSGLVPRAASRIRRVYNGLDLTEFSFASPVQRAPRIIGVGRLVEKKGFADLIEACGLLKQRGASFECEIVGEGELGDSLRGQIAERGLESVVQMPGAIPQAELRQRISGAAVLAAPCVVGADGNRDGLPTVLTEAMALGTPAVSTDVTGIPEIVRNGSTGLLVGQHSPPELADALARLLDDADLRVRLARAARALVEEEFDARRNAAIIRQSFEPAKPSIEQGDGAAPILRRTG